MFPKRFVSVTTGVESAVRGAQLRNAVEDTVSATGKWLAKPGARSLEQSRRKNNPGAVLKTTGAAAGGALIRSFVPAAPEILDTVAAVGARNTMTLAATQAAPLAVVAGSAAAGFVVGDVTEKVVTKQTGSRKAGVGAGVLAGAAAGAAVGGAIGSLGFGITAVPGAAIGAGVGAVAGFVGAYW